MIVTDKFVFVHLPRTGGTFVSEVIMKFFPSANEIGHHTPRKLLPTKYSHLPVLGMVRNPWEFYVSWYHYVLPKEAASNIVSWMSENGRLGFTESIRNLINVSIDCQRTDVLIDLLPENIDYSKRYIPTVTKDAIRRIRGTGVGYYSFRFHEMLGNVDDVFICRTETLRQDLLAFFEKIGAATDKLRDYVLHSDKVNAAEHLHYSTYYTPALAGLVLLRDEPLISRFGYVFEQAPSVENKRPMPSIK